MVPLCAFNLHFFMTKYQEPFLCLRYLNILIYGVAQWIECRLVNQRVASQFDSQSGHMPGLQARSPVRGEGKETTH